MSALKRVIIWLLGSLFTLLFLIFAAVLLLPQLLDSSSAKQKIQAIVAEKTSVQVEYKTLAFSYLPWPSIELRQVTLAVPELVQGNVAVLRVTPELLPLLIGDLHLAKLELETPELRLELPEAEVTAEPFALDTLEKSLAAALEPLTPVASGLELLVNNGRLSVNRDKQNLVAINGLTLQLALLIHAPAPARARLKGEISELSIYRNGHHETIKGARINGHVLLTDGGTSLSLEHLIATEPALELSGSLILAPTSPALSLTLSGSDIDADAARRTALALAGDTSPTREIFDYLRGGQVPQISFTSQGETPSELGDLNNILIEGRLQDGKVSIAEIKLDLTEVNGDVVISKGVLKGSGISTRLEGSTGHDGSLKVGLTKSNNLFNLELMLDADLAQTQIILKRIVGNQTFGEEIDKITNLKGTGIGKLVLGDSLTDIKARVDVTDLNLVADYQLVPFPIMMTKGQITFIENQVVLNNLGGKLGHSDFSGLSCTVDWEEALHLDIRAGQFDLDLDELSPWVATFDGVSEDVKELKQVTGRLALSALSLKGAVSMPEQWQFSVAGAVKELNFETPYFPARINLAQGDFKLDTEEFYFQNLAIASLDAELVLAGSLKGFPQNLDQVELTIDGKLGQDSVVWLRDTFEVPEAYTLQTPLTLTKAQIIWQPDATTSLKGKVSITKGPELTLDVAYRPEQLQFKQLVVRDQHSDADMVFNRGVDEIKLNFTGTLQHETLKALFVDQPFGKGRLEGDFDVKVPLGKSVAATAKGHLKGEGLQFPMPSGDKITIEQIDLDANGAKIKADAKALSWNALAWDPVKATIDFEQDKINVNFTEAKMCGINSPGLLTIAGKDLSLDFALDGKSLNLATNYSCLTGKVVKMTGTLDSSGQVHAQGEARELVSTLQGPFEMTFTNGVIEQNQLLARILEVLNVTEIVKGRLPKLDSTGFAYATLTMQGKFQNGKFLIEKLYMDGETLDILGSGFVDIEQQSVDIQLLAAPFKTVDRVVRNIPGVNYLLAGSLVTIPVSIKGNLAEPKVQVMSASSVGTALKGLGERTLKSPLRLIETILPVEKKTDK